MKKETKILLDKSIDSLILAVEHFNRPWDCGRKESVLILMDHSFELLLKSSILNKNHKIREPRRKTRELLLPKLMTGKIRVRL